jgi:NADH dehydrogenase
VGEKVVVTGAFGYTGRRIAHKLLERGFTVETLTDHPDRPHPFGGQIQAHPFTFDDPDALSRSLEGASVLFNTYWIRFDHGRSSFDRAVSNTSALFDAAQRAGVGRIVHISITNPHDDPTLPYFAGKSKLEHALTGSGVPYGIVRPTVVFGHGDVFINNLAWLLRTFPVFAVPGDGSYRMQPVHVDDVADLCLDVSFGSNAVVDAAGPDVVAFWDLLEAIKRVTGARCKLFNASPALAVGLARAIGLVLRDVPVTSGEIAGLMRELVVSRSGSPCRTSFLDYLLEEGPRLGSRYESEIARNYAATVSGS